MERARQGMKLDLSIPPDAFEECGTMAREAEEWGLDGVWVSETNHDPFIRLVVAAGQTRRIQLGTAIALAFPRSPVSMAYTCWDIQRLSRGRFILGLGSQVKGHLVRRFSTEWRPPVSRMREAIQLMRAVWKTWQTGEKLEFSGKHYRADLMTPFFSPPPIENPEIPIFLAAVNSGMCRLAGEVCDGVHIHPLHTSRYIREAILPSVGEGARRVGRETGNVQVAAPVFAAIGDSGPERVVRLEAIRRQISFYASTRTYRGVLELHGWEVTGDRLHDLSVKGDWAGMARLVTDEMVEEFAVTGTAEEAADAVRKRYNGLVDRVSLYAHLDGETWRRFATAFRT